MVGRRVENNLAEEKPPFDGLDLPAAKTPGAYNSTGHKPVKKVNLNFLKR